MTLLGSSRRRRRQFSRQRVRSTQVKGLTDPKVTIKGSSWMTKSASNDQVHDLLIPIVMRYLRVKKKVAKMRKQLKGVDRRPTTTSGRAMWDEAHEREGKARKSVRLHGRPLQ